MSDTATVNEIAELRDEITRANAAYYRPGMKQIMSDADYDARINRLRQLDPNDPLVTGVGVQYSPEELRTKTVHMIPMGSLDNTDNGIVGYPDWYEKIKTKLGHDVAVMASHKVDGGSMEVVYLNGELKCVVTRGNGVEGEDITANAVHFQYLPAVLPEPVNITVRGEAVLYKADFIAIQDRDNVPEADRSNPRNVGNGFFGRDSGQDSEYIRLIAFNVHTHSDHTAEDFESEAAKFAFLERLGFKVVESRLCNDEQELMAFYTETADGRDDLPYEIDGVVVTINEVAAQNKFVTKDPKTRLRPKYARAIKFPHKSGITTIDGIILSVGHSGVVVPTAELREVRIGGVNVTHALLNNWDEVQRLDISINDEVEVILAGDIIPKVIRRVGASKGGPPIAEPAHCPVCGTVTTRNVRGSDSGAATYCANPQCPAIQVGKIDHFIGDSKKGVGILDIGDGILKALWDNGMVSDAADLYTLQADQIAALKLDGGQKIGLSRATTIVNNIAAKRELPVHTFLGSLGIDLLGRRRVQQLQEAASGQLDTLDDWLDDQKLASIEIPGFGPTIRHAVRTGIDNNRKLIDKFKAAGVVVGAATPAAPPQPVVAQPGGVAGRSFCFTGTRELVPETQAAGGIIKGDVSKGLDFLVQKDVTSQSNKTRKAEQYGTRIISIEFLRKVLNGDAQFGAAVAADE